MKITGGIFNDVAIEAGPEFIGDTLSIALAQIPNSAAVWLLEVWVNTSQGEFVAGRITTNTVAADGGHPSRVVAFATVPGATGWKVLASSATSGEEAELTLASSRNGSSSFGVVKNTTL